MKKGTSEEINLRLPVAKLGRFDAAADTVQVYYADDHLVLLHKRHRELDGQMLPRLWADFRHLNVFDALLQANTSHASGVLVVELGDDVHKSVYLKNGEIIFAQSSLNEDRLGESLIRAGTLTQKQLDDAAQAITATRKLGRILIDDGLITPKELFAGVRHQVEEIIIGLIAEKNGRLAFYAGIGRDEDVVTLPLETQRLLIQGLRQTPPWAAAAADAGERSLYLSLANNPNQLGLNAEERRLVTLLSGGISVRQLIEQSGFGLINTYRYVHQLLLRDVVTLQMLDPDHQPRVGSAQRKQLHKALTGFNSTYTAICGLLVETASAQKLQGSLNSFFSAMSGEISKVFAGARADGGVLNIETILENLKAAEATDQRTILDSALRELINFLLFESHHLAPPDTVKQIVALIQKMELF